MHCIILAGGFAPQLHPLTKALPMALLPIKGRTLVDYVCDDIQKQKDIVTTTVVTNELYFPLLKRHFSNAFPEYKINVVNNGATTTETEKGEVKDLLITIQNIKLENDDLLVVASDTYTSLKMQDFIRFYKQFKGITLAAFEGRGTEKIRERRGYITVKNNRVTEFIENPKNLSSTLMTIPHYILPKASISLLFEFNKTGQGTTLSSFISWALSHVPIYVYNMGTGRYFDIDSIETYEDAKAKI